MARVVKRENRTNENGQACLLRELVSQKVAGITGAGFIEMKRRS
jgi:hypothetical protein